ncbi:hypothetical protein AAMO2058_000941600 [Amorphochlora amoebiformis]|eukprot:1327243-Amorphochlora_amoeboformis.AAC.1
MAKANLDRVAIPVGGGGGAYSCLEYLKKTRMKISEIHLVAISDDVKKYNKQSSRAKATARIERQEAALKRCLTYCNKEGLKCKPAKIIASIPNDGKSSSERIASEVCKYAMDNDIGTVATGSRKLSGLKRWVVGSIGQLIHRDCTKCHYIQVRHD